MKWKIIAITFASFSAILLIILLYLGLKPNHDQYLPVWEEKNDHSQYDLAKALSGTPSEKIIEQFPYHEYVSNVNMSDIVKIENDIKLIDSLSKDHYVSLTVMVTAYSDSMKHERLNKYTKFNPDSLSLFLMEVDGYKYYARVPGPNQDYYAAVYHFWMSEISNLLDRYTKQDPNLKYNFKYRYLAAICNQNKFGTAPNITETEKIIHNIALSKWDYLYQRLWSAPKSKRLLFFTAMILTLLLYIAVLVASTIFIVKKIKHKLKNMKKITAIFIFLLFVNGSDLFAQSFNGYVETENAVTRGDKIKVIKMSRKDNHVKVKYFACKENGTLVGDRYREWAKNKRVIAYSSGTYMNDCDDPYRANPVGVCFDNGNSVNERIQDNMDGIVIVYATGGVVASNLKEGNLSVKEASTNTSYTLDLRKPLDFTRFKRWAATEDATVFQTHLLYYKDVPGVGSNGSQATRERRFLAVCKDEDNDLVHCLVNLAGNNTLYDATTKVAEYLKRSMDMSSIIYIINLDTGCQNIFQAFDDYGKQVKADNFSGTTNISNASNLLVYYYE